MRVPVTAPPKIMPDKIPGLECECQNRPVNLALEPAMITWLKRAGDQVEEGEPLLEGECQKRVITFPAPCSGVLVEIVAEDGDMVSSGQVLGYIETGGEEK